MPKTLLAVRADVLEYTGIAIASLVGCGVYASVALGLKVSEAQYLQERIGGRFLKRFAKS